jgi:hypothetical protein
MDPTYADEARLSDHLDRRRSALRHERRVVKVEIARDNIKRVLRKESRNNRFERKNVSRSWHFRATRILPGSRVGSIHDLWSVADRLTVASIGAQPLLVANVQHHDTSSYTRG